VLKCGADSEVREEERRGGAMDEACGKAVEIAGCWSCKRLREQTEKITMVVAAVVNSDAGAKELERMVEPGA
jgi:hypothetical protein